MLAELAAGTAKRPSERTRVGLREVLLKAATALMGCWRGAALAMPGMAGLIAVRAELTLHGRRVSGGCATGRARRVVTVADAEAFQADDVLAAADCSDAVLACLPLAGAIVLEGAGELCAAAALARELGIPAVFAVREVMRSVWGGAWLTVDGDCGTISLTEGW